MRRRRIAYLSANANNFQFFVCPNRAINLLALAGEGEGEQHPPLERSESVEVRSHCCLCFIISQ